MASQQRSCLGRSLRVWRSVTIGVVAALSVSLMPALAQDATPGAAVVQPGELTQARPYLLAEDPSQLAITPLLTSGESVGDYQMAGTPDGLGAYQDGDDVVVFMNHEWRTDEGEHISDARVSRLTLDPATGAVRSGSYPIDGSEGYWSFCSAFLAGPEVGFDSPVFLTGEESTGSEHGGLALAVDGGSSEVTELPWLGHIRHENQVVVPGFAGKTVVVTTDDDAAGSELYLFVADSPADVLSGNGQLYVFKADNAAGTADIAKGDDLTGTFVPVDEADNADPDALQEAVDAAGAFTFVRLEDVTYDRTTTTTIYFADTGDNEEPNLATPTGDPVNGNGRLYRLALDPTDPTKVTSLQVLLDGDAGDDLRNPDNLDANATTIMLQEDLNGYNRAADSEATGRILAYDIASGALTSIAKIDQSDDPSLVVEPGDEAGSWESSGIIDVSDLFGEGAWLVDVQAHTLEVDQFGDVDEGGQLLLLRQTTPAAATPEAAVPTVVATVAPEPTVVPVETAVPVEPTVPVAPTVPVETAAPAETVEPVETVAPTSEATSEASPVTQRAP